MISAYIIHLDFYEEDSHKVDNCVLLIMAENYAAAASRAAHYVRDENVIEMTIENISEDDILLIDEEIYKRLTEEE